MTYAFLTSIYGSDVIDGIMNEIEYAPHTDPHWDPFSVVYDVSGFILYNSLCRCANNLQIPGADKNTSMLDCTSPAGYSSNTSSQGVLAGMTAPGS